MSLEGHPFKVKIIALKDRGNGLSMTRKPVHQPRLEVEAEETNGKEMYAKQVSKNDDFNFDLFSESC